MSIAKAKYKKIKIEVENHLAWITINDPENHNALSLDVIDDLTHALGSADRDEQIRVMILSGEGKSFCSGGNIKNMELKKGMFSGDSNQLRENYMKGIQRIPKVISELSTPLIAMVNGAAIGAGLDLSCMCDIRIASDRAIFGETFSKLALVPGDGGTYFLQRIIGLAKAMELSLTARIFGASEAKEMGLVSEVCDGKQLKVKAREMAQAIAQNSPVASSMIKKAIYHAYHSDLHSHLDLLAAYQGITQRTQDHFEGLSAMKEKRKPDFKGV